MSKKICFKCGEEKWLHQFYKHPQMADGHVNKCKECNKRDVAVNYSKKREQYAKYERERFKRPERKEQHKKYFRKRREIFPSKVKAHYTTTNAIRDGKLVRKPCEVCGEKKVEAHHHDYNKPLDVRWLCRAHHLEVHGKEAYNF